MGLICEREIDYYDTKFVQTDDGMYVRMIKKHVWSKWKLVVYKGSNKPILFFKKKSIIIGEVVESKCVRLIRMAI